MDKLFDGADHNYYPAWVCFDCGNTYGRGYPEGHVCTSHNGTCGICGEQKRVTEPRDFGHLKLDWREQYEASNFKVQRPESGWYEGITEKHFELCIQKPVAAEREACAKVCEDTQVFDYEGEAVYGEAAADAIRMRSNCEANRVSCAFETGDIVRVERETYHGKPAGTLAEVMGVNEIGWPRIKYNARNIETLPPDFLVLICLAQMRSS